MTALLGVIGDPVSHSLSPEIHNAWLRAAGIDARYDPIHVVDGALPAALSDLSDRAIVGLNITLPHKRAALDLSAKASKTAQVIGAANTLTRLPAGGWSADNTDAAGFMRALKLAGVTAIRGKNVLVLGAGGAARAIVYALHEAGADIVILNRTLERAAQLSADITQSNASYSSLDEFADYVRPADMIINTTSRGFSESPLQLPPGGARLFFDISYGRSVEAQLIHATGQGWRAEDGLAMLVYQAAKSFELWFDRRPDTSSALKHCREIVEAKI